ncbi:MAG: glycosyltransferase [Spirochaetales bacterium]|jgi:hypothetical protein|nr:glycosyltransferase [Spirochaetales bacterium]
MNKISVLTLVDRIACFYSLYPFLLFGGKDRFDFTASARWCLTEDTNDVLIMMRQFIKPDAVDTGLLQKLRAKYKTLVYFHDDAGGGIPRLEVLPYVDLFYTKALFRDRSLYKKPLYGKELYSDYYHTKYGVEDPAPKQRAVVEDESQLAKLRLSWNIGAGDYPREKLRQRAGVACARVFGPRAARLFYTKKDAAKNHTIKNYTQKQTPPDPVSLNSGEIDVHARILATGQPSIAYQRVLIMERIANDPRFLLGGVSQKRYNKELCRSKIVLSPFGWGELCLRDFEAVRAGSLLLKPRMEHLETWPDIFRPHETYVPFSWDADDLLETTNTYLADDRLRRNVAYAALDAYRNQLAGLEERFESIIKEIISL